MTEYYADNTLEHNVYMRSGKASEFGELVYQESGMDVDQSSLVFEITRECVYYVVGTWRRAFRKGKVFKCEAQPSGTIDPLVKTYSDEFVTIGTARELGPFSEYFSGDIYYDSTICIVPSCREVAAAAYKEEMLLMMSADDVAVFCTAKTALGWMMEYGFDASVLHRSESYLEECREEYEDNLRDYDSFYGIQDPDCFYVAACCLEYAGRSIMAYTQEDLFDEILRWSRRYNVNGSLSITPFRVINDA